MLIRTLFVIPFALFATAAVAAEPVLVPTTKAPAVTQLDLKASRVPLRIQRRPIAPLPAGTINSRVLGKTEIAAFVDRGLIVGRVPVTKTAIATAPGREALLIILENGGVMNNVDPALRRALNHDFVTVTCQGLEFELPEGKTIVDLIGDIAGQLMNATSCLNPANWRRETFNPLTWLNEQTDFALEAAVTANNSLVNTQTRYDRVVVMEDRDAVPARVLAMVRQLAPEYVIDVHVLTHGGAEAFIGNNVAFNQSNFFGVLEEERRNGLPLFLRAVYQMNCVSGTLKDNWRGLGAISVNGTTGTNLNNMPHQYFHYLQKWLAVTGMRDASDQSFQEAALYTRPVYTLVGLGDKVDVSRLTAEGSTANATVNTTR